MQFSSLWFTLVLPCWLPSALLDIGFESFRRGMIFKVLCNHIQPLSKQSKERYSDILLLSRLFSGIKVCAKEGIQPTVRCAETVMNSSLLLMLAVVLLWLVARRLQREVGLQQLVCVIVLSSFSSVHDSFYHGCSVPNAVPDTFHI